MTLTKMKKSADDYNEYHQQIFELKLELLCEYKRNNPHVRVFLTEENLNRIFKNYKISLNN
jgi:hypothetical protein